MSDCETCGFKFTVSNNQYSLFKSAAKIAANWFSFDTGSAGYPRILRMYASYPPVEIEIHDVEVVSPCRASIDPDSLALALETLYNFDKEGIAYVFAEGCEVVISDKPVPENSKIVYSTTLAMYLRSADDFEAHRVASITTNLTELRRLVKKKRDIDVVLLVALPTSPPEFYIYFVEGYPPDCEIVDSVKVSGKLYEGYLAYAAVDYDEFRRVINSSYGKWDVEIELANGKIAPKYRIIGDGVNVSVLLRQSSYADDFLSCVAEREGFSDYLSIVYGEEVTPVEAGGAEEREEKEEREEREEKEEEAEVKKEEEEEVEEKEEEKAEERLNYMLEHIREHYIPVVEELSPPLTERQKRFVINLYKEFSRKLPKDEYDNLMNVLFMIRGVVHLSRYDQEPIGKLIDRGLKYGFDEVDRAKVLSYFYKYRKQLAEADRYSDVQVNIMMERVLPYVEKFTSEIPELKQAVDMIRESLVRRYSREVEEEVEEPREEEIRELMQSYETLIEATDSIQMLERIKGVLENSVLPDDIRKYLMEKIDRKIESIRAEEEGKGLPEETIRSYLDIIENTLTEQALREKARRFNWAEMTQEQRKIINDAIKRRISEIKIEKKMRLLYDTFDSLVDKVGSLEQLEEIRGRIEEAPLPDTMKKPLLDKIDRKKMELMERIAAKPEPTPPVEVEEYPRYRKPEEYEMVEKVMREEKEEVKPEEELPEEVRWEIEKELRYLRIQRDIGQKMHDQIRLSLQKLRELGYPEEKIEEIRRWFE